MAKTWNEIAQTVVRDIKVNKVILESETTGMLPRDYYENPDATEIVLSIDDITATNVKDAIEDIYGKLGNGNTWDNF